MLLIIDNYDSFTYNLVHYFEEIGQSVKVFRNDEISVEKIFKFKPNFTSRKKIKYAKVKKKMAINILSKSLSKTKYLKNENLFSSKKLSSVN